VSRPYRYPGHPGYSAEDAGLAGAVTVPADRVEELARRSATTPSGAVYFDWSTPPAEAQAAARYVLGTPHVEFAGMVLGTMPSYRPSIGRGQEDGL